MIEEKSLCILCNLNKITAKDMCRLCYQKEYNNKNRDRINYLSRTWAKEHKNETKLYVRTTRSKFNNLKSKAKSRNLYFNINESEYANMIKLSCYYCNGFFSLPETGGGLDRLNNELGYDINNIVSCCEICNKTRNDNWSPEETKIIVQAGITFRKLNNEK